MPRYVITANPVDAVGADLANLRKEYDKFSARWLPPHITLVPPFFAEMLPETVQKIQTLPLRMQVTLGGWGMFRRPDRNVIWLDPGDKVADAAHRLYATVPDLRLFTASEPSFHITVASRIPDAEFDRIWGELTKITVEGQCLIANPTVYQWRRSDEYWTPIGE